METIARGDVPKTLQTIAYISIPNSSDLEFFALGPARCHRGLCSTIRHRTPPPGRLEGK